MKVKIQGEHLWHKLFQMEGRPKYALDNKLQFFEKELITFTTYFLEYILKCAHHPHSLFHHHQMASSYMLFFIKNLAQGLVLKIPYFRTSFYQLQVLKVPY